MAETEELRRKFASNDPWVRQVAGLELYQAEEERAILGLVNESYSLYEAEHILEVSFDRLQQRLLNEPLSLDHPSAYFRTIVRNVKTNRIVEQARLRKVHRDMAKQWDTSQVPNREVEEIVEGRLEIELARSLLFHIENDIDRQIALMRYRSGYKPNEIAMIMGRENREVYNSLLRSNRKIKELTEEEREEYRDKATPWERLLAFPGDENAIGVSFMGISPQDIHPDCEQELLKDLDIDDLNQSVKQFAPFLRTEDYYSDAPRTKLSYVSKAGLANMALRGGAVRYVDYDLFFHRQTENGTWSNTMVLANKVEYEGTVDLSERYFDEHTDKFVDLWRFPEMGVSIRKPFSPKKFAKPNRLDVSAYRIHQHYA